MPNPKKTDRNPNRHRPRLKSAPKSPLIRKLERLNRKAMGADRFSFLRRIRNLEKQISAPASETDEKKGKHLEAQIRASMEKRKSRQNRRPVPAYDGELPIVSKREEIISAIREHSVVIISGETGSGKTTQIPKFCLEAGRGIDGLIGCTQPRRIAALTVAARIAEELGEAPGISVGHKIRFQEQTGGNAFIKIMTDGILLAEAQGDRWLNAYDTLIVDEAHERSLNIDFVLGLLKTLIHRRRNLKLIITSATIDTEKFSRAFDDAPVIEVSGRMYPVEVRYMDSDGKGKNGDLTHVDMAVRAVERLHQESPYGGDILVFMPTEQDIRETCEMLEGRDFGGVRIMPLFGRLSAGDQSRVFARTGSRKIIVSTNVAETSVTIPGIKYVIDTGLARISQYSPRSRTTGLPVAPVSRSSADQRMGRCGRVENGICIRLYSEEDYQDRPRFTPPEILRSNLAEVILRMMALRLGDVRRFPFIDPPSDRNIRDGYRLLEELGAIVRKKGDGRKNDESGPQFTLTDRGRAMAKLPLDPRLSRMLLESRERGCLSEIRIIASALSIQDPRERPAEKQKLADQAHAQFADRTSDFVSLLNIWNTYHETRGSLKSIGKMRKYCTANFLSFRRMREWRDIHYQISTLLEEQGLNADTAPVPPDGKPEDKNLFSPRYAAIHQSILCGFLSNIALKKEKQYYQAAGDRDAMIFPGSGVFENPGTWIVAAEMVETTRLFARGVAHIDPAWLEPLGGDQCRYAWFHPRWERKQGRVVVTEQVSLYGLIFQQGRTVAYGPVRPDEATEIFIRSALVEGDLRESLPFMNKNQQLIRKVQEMEDRVRRRGLLVSPEDQYRFYAERIHGISDVRSLKQLIRRRGGDGFLRMKEADVLQSHPDRKELTLFPERISLGNTVFPCDYVFDPGKEKDGVTVKIPTALAPSVPPESMDWLVPGLFAEKVTALIRGLPKEYRRRLVPVNDTAEIIAKEMPRSPETPLITALSRFIHRRFNVDIPASAWDAEGLPPHLHMRISVRDPQGEEVRAGRSTAILVSGPAPEVDPDRFESERKKWERDGIVSWDFDDLPETVTLRGVGEDRWLAYPGLADIGDCSALRLFKDRNRARSSHRLGVMRLLTLKFAGTVRQMKHSLSLPKEAEDAAVYFGGKKMLEKQLFENVLKALLAKDIRTREAFDAHAGMIEGKILRMAGEKRGGVLKILRAFRECREEIFNLENAGWNNRAVIQFLSEQRDALARLIPENFLELYNAARLAHMERYIRALTLRVRRGVLQPEKDKARDAEVRRHTDRLQEMLKNLSPSATEEKRNAVEAFFWLIEEFKVSVFAQELKTPVKVSGKRLEKMYLEIERMV